MCSATREENICWFCGQLKNDYTSGSSIGRMVYSEDINILVDMDNSCTQNDSRICHECLEKYLLECGPIDQDYQNQHLNNYKLLQGEICDVITYLVDKNKRKYPLGCWFGWLPNIEVRKKWYSLRIADLYDLGLRFSGMWSYEKEDMESFFFRFPVSENKINKLPDGFEEHINSTMHCPYPSFISDIAQLRAEIYDITVWGYHNQKDWP